MPKRSKDTHLNLISDATELYYAGKLKKSEIAKKLKVSITHVTRLLNQAEKLGIVQVEIKLVGRLNRLESAIKRKYGLKEVKIVADSNDYADVQKRIGTAAAEIFEKYVAQLTRTRVGIGGGQTIYNLVDALENRPRPIDVYPMSLFGRGSQVEYVDSVFLSMLLYMKSQPNSRGFLVGIPPMPNEQNLAKDFSKMLLKEIPEVKEVYEGARKCELAFVGLGNFMASRDILREYEKLGFTFDTMTQANVIGGINYNYFDAKGKQVGSGVLTTDIDALRSMSSDPWRLIVLVSGGEQKRAPVKIAVETKMVNGLVTDESVGNYLLEN